MKESDVRNRESHARYLELVRQDAKKLASDPSVFVHIPCPVCGASQEAASFHKSGFRYASCGRCDTLYANPRPRYEALQQMYRESESTRYWVEEFFKPVAEARREKIFRPRAQFVAGQFSGSRAGRVGDIGAGFGLFLEELRRMWPDADLTAIEPSSDMAAICRGKGIPVLELMLENVSEDHPRFDLLTAFELFEHLHDPLEFLVRARSLLNPGGYLLMTTLSGLGFDIQVLGENSRSVSPPHHLNFANPFTFELLLKRAGFDLANAATPGELDWDILDRSLDEEPTEQHRFWRTLSKYGSDPAKSELQDWIKRNNLSSHMRIIARAT